MPKVATTRGYRRWRRTFVVELTAALLPFAVLLVTALLSVTSLADFHQSWWLVWTWSAIGVAAFGSIAIRRLLRARPPRAR